MYQLIHHIDLFGIDQKLSFVVGGLTTLVLYSLSLAYFIVQLVDWQDNNKLPKYTSLKAQVSENETIQSQLVFAEISQVLSNSYGQIDLFDPNNLVLFPQIIQTSSDGTDIKLIDSEFKQEMQEDGTIFHKLLIQNITLKAQPQITLKKKAQEYYLLLQFCDSNFISQNPLLKCANKELIQKYKEQQVGFQISIFLNQFDFKSKSLKQIPKTYQIEYVYDKVQFYDFFLQVNSLIIDDGILLQNTKRFDFFNQISYWYKQYDIDYSYRFQKTELLAVLHFQVDQLKDEGIAEYPKISEILADTGSIVSFIMLFSFFAQKYNESLNIEKTKTEIIKMYYNDFEQYQINKNWKGQIQSLSSKKKNEIYQQKYILEFIQKLETLALSKLSLLNLQREIQQLQLLISKVLSQEEIKAILKAECLLSQFLTTEHKEEQGEEVQQISKQINQVQPSCDKIKENDEKDSVNYEQMEQDLKKRVGFFAIKPIQPDDCVEQNELVEKCSKSEISVINLDISQIQ